MSDSSHSKIRVRNSDYQKSNSESNSHNETHRPKKKPHQSIHKQTNQEDEIESNTPNQIQRRNRSLSEESLKKEFSDTFNAEIKIESKTAKIQRKEKIQVDRTPIETRTTEISKTSATRRNRSVNQHPKRTEKAIYNQNKIKSLSQTTIKPSNKPFKISEDCISIEFYYKEKTPRPFDGIQVFNINDRPSKSSIKQDELLQFVPYIVYGPTYNNRPDKKVNSTRSNSTEKIKLLKNSKEKHSRSKSVSQKADVILTCLFNDDFPNNFFDFDFGTVYTNSILETTQFIQPFSDSIITIEEIDSAKINFNDNQQTILNSLIQLFQTESHQSEKNNLTKLFEQDPIQISNSSNNPSIKNSNLGRKNKNEYLISANSFSEFRFGHSFKFDHSDLLHLSTWHNLGVPPSLVTKNLILLFQSNLYSKKFKEILMSICQYIIEWLTHFPLDFYDNSNNSELIDSLLKAMATKSKSSLNFINIIGTTVFNLNKHIITPDDFLQKAKQPIYKSISQINHLIDLTIDPYILANHFTYLDLLILRKLQRIDFCHSNFDEFRKNCEELESSTQTDLFNSNFLQNYLNHSIKSNQTNSTIQPKTNGQLNNQRNSTTRSNSNIQTTLILFKSRFNKVVNFICSSILVNSNKKRARNISYWIKMMYYSKRIKNFTLLAEIDSALSSYSIKRLTESWRLVNDNALIAFSRLHNFFNKIENQDEMFNEIKLTIPFIGIFISQLYQIDFSQTKSLLNQTNTKSETNSVENDSQNDLIYDLNNEINILNIIEQIFEPWGVEMEFELDQNLLNECRKLNGKAQKVTDLIIPSIQFEELTNSEKEMFKQYF